MAQEDMRWDGRNYTMKDLDEMWDSLEEEQGKRWGPEDTVVVTE